MDTRKLLHHALAAARIAPSSPPNLQISQVTKQANLNHSQLAIATLGVTIGGAVLATSGKKAEAPTSPPINAKSSDEESFVKYVDAILHLPR
jgi:F-type H+-transporting ATPase subunit k